MLYFVFFKQKIECNTLLDNIFIKNVSKLKYKNIHEHLLPYNLLFLPNKTDDNKPRKNIPCFPPKHPLLAQTP
ncbi:hypothetical protein M23134_00408 [Microscilla marina ATCC 23134]|uniref:Uncharacterized protein n=1 Tax=Microscilla marina ATCC 23134 TaxID=313606 RepID=A1ZIY8_MICM2|nr:hypothetical protein M23134_00408 [Microscilla marina ATCC 23134]